MGLLQTIESPRDIRALDHNEIRQLCCEIRSFLIDSVSRSGGHLASNLGVVELTVALHKVYDTEKDRLLFDVGHQCYVHKMLTGRLDAFQNLHRFGGISGFPKPSESVHDALIAGHASDSISAALGMARARTLAGADYDVVAVIGDGALTGGMAYEALSDAGESGEPLVVILNDNEMSIAHNVGGIARYLSHERIKPSYYSFKKYYRQFMGRIPGGKGLYRLTHKFKTMIKEAMLHCSVFEEMGFEYLGPVDGHDVDKLAHVITWAKSLKKPALVHAITVKGKGYTYAERHPNDYHGVGCFDPACGIVPPKNTGYSGVFGRAMCALAQEDNRICVITAAMQSGTGLEAFAGKYPKRFFDVGIAEEHAVAMAAGLAKQGMIPVFAVYSTFLQRSFDMLVHDVGIDGLHVVFAVDRAGLVGEDGETHHGVFDIGYLAQIPGMTVLCPANFSELEQMLRYAVFEVKGPVAVRYPRGSEACETGADPFEDAVVREGADITVVAYGNMLRRALDAAGILEKKGVSAEVIKLSAIMPLSMDRIVESVRKTSRLLVAEECVNEGSVGQRIAAGLAIRGEVPKKVILKNLGNRFIPHGSIGELHRYCGIDAQGLADAALEGVGDGNRPE